MGRVEVTGEPRNNDPAHAARLEVFVVEQALPIVREVGDRAGEAVTRYNIAMQLRAAGRLDEAVAELEVVVALDRAVQHPDLDADTAMLQRVRAEAAEQRGAPS